MSTPAWIHTGLVTIVVFLSLIYQIVAIFEVVCNKRSAEVAPDSSTIVDLKQNNKRLGEEASGSINRGRPTEVRSARSLTSATVRL